MSVSDSCTLLLPAELQETGDFEMAFRQPSLIIKVTARSGEVYTKSHEADYDAFFVACHVRKVISRVLRVPLMSRSLVCEISSSQYAFL